jgi:hypothetical protein
MRYFTKIAGRPISEAEAYRRASPAQRATWWPQGAPVKAEGAGPGVDLVDRVGLERAMAAGRRALAAGYGGAVRADGRVPCLHCAICDAGAFDRCQQAKSRAEAQLHAAQACDADRARAEVVLAELGGLYVELAAGLG